MTRKGCTAAALNRLPHAAKQLLSLETGTTYSCAWMDICYCMYILACIEIRTSRSQRSDRTCLNTSHCKVPPDTCLVAGSSASFCFSQYLVGTSWKACCDTWSVEIDTPLNAKLCYQTCWHFEDNNCTLGQRQKTRLRQDGSGTWIKCSRRTFELLNMHHPFILRQISPVKGWGFKQ